MHNSISARMTTENNLEEGQTATCCPTGGSIRNGNYPGVRNGNDDEANPRDSLCKDKTTVSFRSTDETEKTGCNNRNDSDEEDMLTTLARNGSSYTCTTNDLLIEEEIVFSRETEDPEKDSRETVFLVRKYPSKDRRSYYKRNKRKIKNIIEEGGNETALYPPDCYSFISLHGPESKYFWFGLTVFSVQMSFLILMILSVVNRNWKVGKIDDNPEEGSLADYIATEASPLLRGAQFMSLLTFVVFADSSMLDVIAAVHTFPDFLLVTTRDKIGCIVASCFLRFVQGTFASFVAFILVFTSTNVIEVILNFTALNFISALDEVAFEFAKIGKYGHDLEEEAMRIEKLPLPVCMYRKHKHVRFWFTIIPVGAIVLVGFLYVVWCQEALYKWNTHKFRIEFGNDPVLQGYSGCFHNAFDREADIFKRDLFRSDARNEESANIGFCIDSHEWVMYKGNYSDPCEADAIVHSSKTDNFDISTVFLEDWFTSSHTPADLYFFESDNEGSNLDCEQFLNNGICDESFNIAFHDYDDGDCCAATCTTPNCEIGGLVNAFGSTNTSGDGYSNCLDPAMVPLTITLEGFISSHDPEVATLSEKDRKYIDDFMPDYYGKTPSDSILSLYCNHIKILKYYINKSMENQSETVMVSDAASCEIRIENTTSSNPRWDDAPIWYINYTVHHEDKKLGELLRGNSFVRGVETFQMMPRCYFDMFSKHMNTDVVVDREGHTQSKALHWMLDCPKPDTDCRYKSSMLSLYALAVLNFAAPISDSTPSRPKDGLWIDKKQMALCSWKNIKCVQNTNINEMDFLHLKLSDIGLSGSIPTEVGLLSTLVRYDASNNALTGIVPSEIGELSLLSVLNLNYNNLTGSIPKEIGQLTSMKEMFMESNHWTDTIPSEIGLLSDLVDLRVGSNALNGSIPSEIGLLTSLTFLSANKNGITGTIPSEIGLLSDLVDLRLGSNALNGSIPSEIGLLTSLTFLSANKNGITGTIPSEIGLLTNLVTLDLNHNGLAGEIPSEIGLLTSLERLSIANNSLTCFIPNEIGSLTSLTLLEIDKSVLPEPISMETEELSALEGLIVGDFP